MADRITSVPIGGVPTPTPKTVIVEARPRPSRPVSVAARVGDSIYSAITFLASLSIFIIILWLLWQLISASQLSIHRFGWSFVTQSDWNEETNSYHALSFIFGTLYSSLIALVLAVPISIGAAVFLSELAPRWIRTPATFLIELLAAIPSVIYGLWGIFVLIPFLKVAIVGPIANSRLPHLPIIGALFEGQSAGYSMLAAGVLLAIMVIPFITAVTRDILRAIPRSQREGSYALGATQWETIAQVVIPYAKSGIIGAVVLGLGRALGETMAVTMVIGNQAPNTPSGISFSLLSSGYTMSSVLANKFNEATPGLNLSALVEIALVLFGVTIVVNIIARMLVFYTAKNL
ncbi:MAG: phosphate ABC transporter permease subunit PstC [Janthinobacterium lividum]